MAVQVDYPGVYIDEFEPAAPIQGAGTAVAAFLGLNAYGPPMRPTLLTSWDAYLRTFAPPAAPPQPPAAPDDDDYLYYAVRGFFENGGRTCFVTAVSNAKPDHFDLVDADGNETVTVTARRAGQQSPPISVKTASASSVRQVKLFAPTAQFASAAAAAESIVLTVDAAPLGFLAGDAIEISDDNSSEPATIRRTSGKTVFLVDTLQNAYSASPRLRLAPLAAFATTFRVVDTAQQSTTSAAKLAAGSVVTFAQAGGANPPPPKTTTVTATRAERISATLTTYRVTVKDGLAGFNLYGAAPVTLQSEEFTLTVSVGTTDLPPYTDLSMSAGHPRYFASVINNDATGAVFATPFEGPPGKRPVQLLPQALQGGSNYDPALIRPGDYGNALALLEKIKDINMVAVPDRTDADVQVLVLDHCSRLHDRFAIFDATRSETLDAIEDQRRSLASDKGFGALYHPWLEVASVKTGQRIFVPPSGHVAGIYARTDLNRGVFKAPAGNECVVNGALGVEFMLSDTDQGIVNLQGVNVIRVFSRGGRPIVWGARTTSENTNWQYVNIRRLFLFLEESIQTGIRGSVFEPNNPALWQKLKRTINAFLTQQWRDGALFGNKAEEAFYVRIDEVLNPDNERALGRLYIEIGVRPSYPAEFIIVRIGIWQGGADVSES